MRGTWGPRHKFKAVQAERDGMKFPSKLEAKRYDELKLLQEGGQVVFFLRQVPFHLPGGVKYVCDFQVFWSDGTVTCEDTKGMKTESFRAKKRMVEALYPVQITVVE